MRAQRVAVVNERLVRLFLDGRDPMGQRVAMDDIVAQNRGLRMALGAGHNQVRLQILREGATLATGGLVLGLVGAYALGRAMQAMLFGTGALSVPVVLVAGLVLLGTALVACYVPARRASAVDPLIALRQ
jgi:ABC-type antimicrobial peptide transport system permease subunit